MKQQTGTPAATAASPAPAAGGPVAAAGSPAVAARRLARRVVHEARALREARALLHTQRTARPWASAAPGGPDDNPARLLRSPVFVLSSIRSGSTLLRVILNSHSMICAPHELHLGALRLDLSNPNATAAMQALGYTQRDLENILWDRMLQLTLAKSGKSVIVDKTPHNTFEYKRLNRVWPQARYIFLLRHPVRVLESIMKAWPRSDIEKQYAQVNRYAYTLHEAQTHLRGHTVRYEDVTGVPEDASRGLCGYLGVPWEAGMLRYVEHDHGRFEGRLGDWHDTIKSGVIRPPAPMPTEDEIPDAIKDACRTLGYL